MKKLKLRQDPQLETYLAAMQSLLFKGVSAYSSAVNWPDVFSHEWILKKLMTEKIKNLDKNHLLRFVEWNLHSGQRASFEKHRLYLFALADEAREQYIQSCANHPALFHELQIVNRYTPSLPNSHIAAVDLAWTVYFTRGGYHLGLLTEEEHWFYLDQCIAINKDAYSNWEDYVAGFIVGVYYMNNEGLQNMYQVSDEQLLIKRLLNGHYSPMRRVDIQGRKL